MKKTSQAVVSFDYGTGACSEANRRVRAPVVRSAPVRRRRRRSDGRAGDFCFLRGKSRAKSPSKRHWNIPQIPRRLTLAAGRETSGSCGGGHTMQQDQKLSAAAARELLKAEAQGERRAKVALQKRKATGEAAAATPEQKRKATGELRRRRSRWVPAAPAMRWSRTKQAHLQHVLLRFHWLTEIASSMVPAACSAAALCLNHGCYLQILQHGIDSNSILLLIWVKIAQRNHWTKAWWSFWLYSKSIASLLLLKIHHYCFFLGTDYGYQMISIGLL